MKGKFYMNDFQKILNDETKQLNDTYYNEIKWSNEHGKYSVQNQPAIDSEHIIIPFGVNPDSKEKKAICLISNNITDYVIDDTIYNKCKIYVPDYDILEGEHVQFPSGLLNFKVTSSETEFMEKFGTDNIDKIVGNLYCFGILETDTKEKFDYLLTELQDYMNTYGLHVPGALNTDFYMINLKHLESWCHNEYWNSYKNKDNTVY